MATKMKIQRTPNDQYVVTIPKAFAEGFGYGQGTVVEFKVLADGSLQMVKLEKKKK